MVGPSPIAKRGTRVDEKNRLRRDLRVQRSAHVASLPASTRGLLFLRPPAPVLALLPVGTTIGLYHAIDAEAPTTAYARWLYENGRKVALPWFADRQSPMQFRLWGDPWDEAELETGPWKVPQPSASASETTPDAVIVPLIGFTADCDRLGQGGGHYDRWLAAYPATQAIGLGWDCQLVDRLPLEPHDRKLDAIVTPTRFYEASHAQ